MTAIVPVMARAPDDPREAVRAPVVGALDRIMVLAAAGFVLVTGAVAVPLLLDLAPEVREAVRLSLPVGWFAYAVITGLWFLARRPRIEGNAWQRAWEMDHAVARMSRLVSSLMLAGWLAAIAALVANDYLADPSSALMTLGVELPALLAGWILAALAWSAWTAAHLGQAEKASEEAFRRYWTAVAARQSAS